LIKDFAKSKRSDSGKSMFQIQDSVLAKIRTWDRTPEICLAAVKKCGLDLRLVYNQTPEICREAIKSDWRALTFVQKQTPEICLEAVKICSLALQYVVEQTPEICLESVKQFGPNLRFVNEQPLEFYMTALAAHDDAMTIVKIPLEISLKEFLRLSKR
jgi:hypothetical protein